MKICEFISTIQAEIGKEKRVIDFYTVPEEIKAQVREYASEKLDYVLEAFVRAERQAREDALYKDVFAHFETIFEGKTREIGDALYALTKEKVRNKILNDGIRPDGRGLTDIRPIWCEVGVLPRVHGTGVFTRGETQALTTCTLGTMSEVQKLEGLDEETSKRYMHHYNFPPYSTGEARPARSPGRREIGHGALAERALEPVLPTEEEFPYAIRTVSEIMSSNGSTSQASVCGSTLALMDAGVPIKRPVAGVAMGLIKADDSDKVVILTDIQGLEDFLGDMDFKVAGSDHGITAIQMDMKCKGISYEIIKTAIKQAQVGRGHILGKMLEALPETRTELSTFAPKIISFKINPDKIREVIGSGGKTINKIIEECGVKIDINDEGKVFIASQAGDGAEKAKAIIESITHVPEVGDMFVGKVVRMIKVGAFVEIAPGKDGMIHISKLAKERVENVEDVVSIGDLVKVEIIRISEKGIDLRLLENLKQ